jgi:hypothetical protein
VGSAAFTDPLYENEGTIATFKKLAFVLSNDLVKSNPYSSRSEYVSTRGSSVAMDIVRSYQRMEQLKEGRFGEKTYTLFRDSSYISPNKLDWSVFSLEPGDGPHQLFACAFTILNFFPEEFKRRYRAEKIPSPVKDVIRTALNVAERFPTFKDKSKNILIERNSLSALL